MIFTAIAATVVMIPLAIYGVPGADDDARRQPMHRSWHNSR